MGTAMHARTAVMALGTALLTGCAAGIPQAPPILSYARTGCATAPDLGTAISLAPEEDKAVWTVDTPVDAGTGCLAHHGVAGPYVVYALPPREKTRLVELGSVLEFTRLFAPEVTLLDGEGQVTRSFEPDSYMFRPGLYSVQFVPQEGERYALVTSNPALVGNKHDTIVAGTSSTYIYTGFGGTNWQSGTEQAMSRGFSYEGMVRANVYRPEKD